MKTKSKPVKKKSAQPPVPRLLSRASLCGMAVQIMGWRLVAYRYDRKLAEGECMVAGNGGVRRLTGPWLLWVKCGKLKLWNPECDLLDAWALECAIQRQVRCNLYYVNDIYWFSANMTSAGDRDRRLALIRFACLLFNLD